MLKSQTVSTRTELTEEVDSYQLGHTAQADMSRHLLQMH